MTKTKSAKAPTMPRASKAEQLKMLVSSPSGITVEDLSAKLGWLPHTTRAALTRMRQTGITLEKLDPAEGSRQCRYRIAGAKK